MDLLYNTAWLCAAKRRKARRSVEPNRLPSASAPSGAGRLLLALAFIGVIVGLLGHAANTQTAPRVVSMVTQSHQGALR
jgi:hypothetical protein